MSTTIKDIHFFISSIGGTGASSLSLLTAEILDSAIYDGYVSRSFLSRFKGVTLAEEFKIDSSASFTSCVGGMFDKLLQGMEEGTLPQNTSIVVDLDSSLTIPFIEYVGNSDFFNDYKKSPEHGNCYLHIIHSTEMSDRTTKDMQSVISMKEHFTPNSIIFWKNEYKMPSTNKEKETAFVEKVKASLGDKLLGVVHVPNNEAVKPIYKVEVYEKKNSIRRAYDSLNIFSKGKLRPYFNGVAEQLESFGFNATKLNATLASSPKTEENISTDPQSNTATTTVDDVENDNHEKRQEDTIEKEPVEMPAEDKEENNTVSMPDTASSLKEDIHNSIPAPEASNDTQVQKNDNGAILDESKESLDSTMPNINKIDDSTLNDTSAFDNDNFKPELEGNEEYAYAGDDEEQGEYAD